MPPSDSSLSTEPFRTTRAIREERTVGSESWLAAVCSLGPQSLGAQNGERGFVTLGCGAARRTTRTWLPSCLAQNHGRYWSKTRFLASVYRFRAECAFSRAPYNFYATAA